MRYMLLIMSNDEAWRSLTSEQRRELGEAHAGLTRELAASGVLVSSAGLADERESTTVRVRDGILHATDGPYVEAKEHLAGYYLIDVAAAEDAVAIAARMPDARYTGVEVRPVVRTDDMEA